eukprot:Em0101g2a
MQGVVPAMSLQDNHKKLIVAITTELQSYVACLEKQRGVGAFGTTPRTPTFHLAIIYDLSPRVLMFIENSFQGVELQGKQRQTRFIS